MRINYLKVTNYALFFSEKYENNYLSTSYRLSFTHANSLINSDIHTKRGCLQPTPSFFVSCYVYFA